MWDPATNAMFNVELKIQTDAPAREESVLNNDPSMALTESHHTPLHEHHVFSLASQHPSASRAFRTMTVPSKAIMSIAHHNADLVTQDSDVFVPNMRPASRNPKGSKCFRALFACYALSNVVTLAHPSGIVYWGTCVSGAFSTLCSYVELRVPTGAEEERIDLAFVIMNMRYVT